MLSMANLSSQQPSRKLSQRWIGPYTIEELVGTHALCLELPSKMGIHPVVNIGRVKKFMEPKFSNQGRTPLDALVMDDGSVEYVVKSILNSRIRRRKLEYLVEWEGYKGTDEAVSWESEANVRGSADEMIKAFHEENPQNVTKAKAKGQ